MLGMRRVHSEWTDEQRPCAKSGGVDCDGVREALEVAELSSSLLQVSTVLRVCSLYCQFV